MEPTNSAPRLFSLIGLTIFGGLAALLTGLIIYIMATDGIDNLRGVPETGWGALVAIIVYLPLASCFGALTVWCFKIYKKYSRAA